MTYDRERMNRSGTGGVDRRRTRRHAGSAVRRPGDHRGAGDRRAGADRGRGSARRAARTARRRRASLGLLARGERARAWRADLRRRAGSRRRLGPLVARGPDRLDPRTQDDRGRAADASPRRADLADRAPSRRGRRHGERRRDPRRDALRLRARLQARRRTERRVGARRAAVRKSRGRRRAARGVVISGGNVDPATFAACIAGNNSPKRILLGNSPLLPGFDSARSARRICPPHDRC